MCKALCIVEWETGTDMIHGSESCEKKIFEISSIKCECKKEHYIVKNRLPLEFGYFWKIKYVTFTLPFISEKRCKEFFTHTSKIWIRPWKVPCLSQNYQNFFCNNFHNKFKVAITFR